LILLRKLRVFCVWLCRACNSWNWRFKKDSVRYVYKYYLRKSHIARIIRTNSSNKISKNIR
jgi:hypothetical protein